MAPIYEKPDKIRRAVVFVKYALPLVCAVWMIIGCAIGCFRLSNDDTKRVRQSVFELAESATTQSDKTVKGADETEKNTIALAKALKGGVAAMWIAIAVDILFSVLLLTFALIIWQYEPDSKHANLLKVRMKYVFPGRWLHFLLPYISMIPMFLPYYVIDKFQEYYRVKSVSDTTAEYFEYSINVSGLNPIIISAALAVIASVVFALAAPWEKGYGLDLFRTYKKDEWYKGEENNDL